MYVEEKRTSSGVAKAGSGSRERQSEDSERSA